MDSDCLEFYTLLQRVHARVLKRDLRGATSIVNRVPTVSKQDRCCYSSWAIAKV